MCVCVFVCLCVCMSKVLNEIRRDEKEDLFIYYVYLPAASNEKEKIKGQFLSVFL